MWRLTITQTVPREGGYSLDETTTFEAEDIKVLFAIIDSMGNADVPYKTNFSINKKEED